jgi:magnesium chelatase subunit D
LAEADAGDATGRATDALLAAACFALDPTAFGGVVVHTGQDETCEAWLTQLRQVLAPAISWRALPAHIDEERLLGGIDLEATLASGRAVRTQGLLRECRGGVVLVRSAERLAPQLAALVGQAMDSAGADGFAVVALDCSREDDERLPAVLGERLALHVDLRGVHPDAFGASGLDTDALAAARQRWPAVTAPLSAQQVLCAAAAACGIDSMRVPLLALRVARASGALAGRDHVGEADLLAAARLVIAPRSRSDPGAMNETDADAAAANEAPDPEPRQPDAAEALPEPADGELADRVLAAARAAIPAQLLASLAASATALRSARSAGRSGALMRHGRRGRPAGVRSGKPRAGARLNIVATLRTAAPWQRLRRAQSNTQSARVLVRVADFRVTHFSQRSETATIFVIDASGSSALHRLAEIKGAVEVLLAECYVRRDQVAVITFRGKRAELLLPPTRSLVRAKRCLAGAAGGGATPLASGIDAARELAEQLRRRGFTPAVVLLTDGQANVGRGARMGREQAQLDALQAATLLGAQKFRTLLIDTSPRPQAAARQLAEAMHCRYLPLPHADARSLAGAVQSGS